MLKQWCMSSGKLRDSSYTTKSFQKEPVVTQNKLSGLPGLTINGHHLSNVQSSLTKRSPVNYIKNTRSCPSSRPRAPGVYLSELLEHLNTRRCREALRRPGRHNHQTIFSTRSHKEEGRPNDTACFIDNTLVTPQRDDLQQQVPLGASTPRTVPEVPRTAGSTQREVLLEAPAKREGGHLVKRKVTNRRTHGRKGHGSKGRASSLKVKVGPEAARRRPSLEDRLPAVSPSPPGSIYPSGSIKVVVRRTKRGGTSYRRSNKTSKAYKSHHPGHTSRACQAEAPISPHVSASGALVCPSSSTVTCSSPSLATTWSHQRLCRGQRQHWPQSTAVPLQEQITPLRDSSSRHAVATAVADEHQQRHVCSLSESHKSPSVLVLTPKEKRAIVGYFYRKNIINFLSGENSEDLNTTSGKVFSNQEVTRINLVSAPRSVFPTKLSPALNPTTLVMANETEQQQNMANNQQSGDVKQMKGYRKKGLVNEKVLLERLSDMSIEDDALAPVIVLSSVEDHDDASPMEEESAPTKTSGKKKGNMKLQASLSLDVPCLNVMDEPKRPPM